MTIMFVLSLFLGIFPPSSTADTYLGDAIVCSSLEEVQAVVEKVRETRPDVCFEAHVMAVNQDSPDSPEVLGSFRGMDPVSHLGWLAARAHGENLPMPWD